MKIFILMTMIATNVFAVCSTPIARRNINQGEIPTSFLYNQDFNVLYSKANSLHGSCVLDDSVLSDQFQDDSVSSSLISNNTITAIKFQQGILPVPGRLLRIRAYTGNASWIKQPEVEYVFVQLVGGGGGTLGGQVGTTPPQNGGDSSFGTHCIGRGGLACRSVPSDSCPTGAAGGLSENGDVNLQGGSGNNLSAIGEGGHSFFGDYGRGGTGVYHNPWGSYNAGGGAGGYCAKVIQKLNLEDNIPIMVGQGGVSGNGTAQHERNFGKSGLVIVYEYGK